MQNNKNNPLIFVVEDNPMYNKLVVSYLKSNKLTNVETYTSGEDAIANLSKNPLIIIQDYLLDGMNGVEVLKRAKKVNPNIEFLFLSGQDSIDVAINSMKYGAYDYIVKDEMALKKLVVKINKIISINNLQKSNKRYRFGVILFFIALILIIIVMITYAILNPDTFGI